MANRGIYGSLSSIPVEMGDCGTAYVDVSPETPNLCFEVPLITTGGAKPLSLSLIYNELTCGSSSGIFGSGFRLSLHRGITVLSGGLSVACPDGPTRSFVEDPPGQYRSPQDPAIFARESPSEVRLFLNPSDYLSYSPGNPYPLSCSSSSSENPSFSVSFSNGRPASISLEGGRTLTFEYAATGDPRVVRVVESKGQGDVLQTVELDYDGSAGFLVLCRVKAFLGDPGQSDPPFRHVRLQRVGAQRLWVDELRSLCWHFTWSTSGHRVSSFHASGPGFNGQYPYAETSVSYGAHSSTVADPSGHSKTTYFDGDVPYLSCDDQGVAEAFRFDAANRRLLYRSGPVCLDPSASVNAGPVLSDPFLAADPSPWSPSSGTEASSPISVPPFAAPPGARSLHTKSLSQAAPLSGLPGDTVTAFALVKGDGSSAQGTSRPSLTVALSGPSGEESATRRAIFLTNAGKAELIAVSLTAAASFSSASASLTVTTGWALAGAIILLRRPASASAGYDALGRLVSSSPESGLSSVAYSEWARPHLIGDGRSFRRLGKPSQSGNYEIQTSASMWGLRSEEGRDISTFLPVWSESRAPGAQGSVQEWRDYGQDLLLCQETGADGVTRSYEYAPGSDLPSGSGIGPDPSDPLLASELSYASLAPWSVSSLSHSASDNLSWAFSYSYDSAHLLMSSATEGPSGALPADLISTAWSHDGLGNPTSVSQSSNAYASMAYSDQHGRRLLSSLSYGTGSFSWSYDELGRPVSVSYAEPNQAPSVLGAYSYDEFGRTTQALGESYSWDDDGSLASMQCGSLSISHSKFDVHSSETISFNSENPTIVSSHGPEACSYGDPRLGEALFQLIPGLSSAVFPEPENAGSSPWTGSAADLTLRGHRVAPIPFAGWSPSFVKAGGAVALRVTQSGYIYRHPSYRFALPPAGGLPESPGVSFGAWLSPSQPYAGAVLMQMSFYAYYSGGNSPHATSSVLVRLAQRGGAWFADLVAQYTNSPDAPTEATILSAPVAGSGWLFLSVGLSFDGAGRTLSSASLRVGGETYSGSVPSGFPSMSLPEPPYVSELSFMGPCVACPDGPGPDVSVLGDLYAPFLTSDGHRLSARDELFAYGQTKRILFGDPSSMASPTAARSFLSPDIPSGFEAIAPLEGDFSLIAGSLAPSSVVLPGDPARERGSAFRYDPVEHRFRHYSAGGSVLFESPLGDDPVCFAFSFRPLEADGAPDRCLCSLGIGALTPLKVVLRGSSVYLQRGGSNTYLGLAGPSSSKWLGIELWVETRKVGILTRKAAMAKVYLGGSSFSSAQVELGPYLPIIGDAAFVRLGGDPSAPFYGFSDRLGAWLGDWSSQKMSALQSCFAAQKASVEEIDPFGQLTSRSTHGPSGLSVSSSFEPLVAQEGAESLRRPGLISSEGHSVNGTPVSSLGREYEYDYFGRLIESFAVGADHEEDDPLDSYVYDGLGRLKSWTDADGDKTQYTWSGGHVTKVKKGQLVTAAFSYSGHRLTAASLTPISYRADAPMLVDRIGGAAGQGGSYASLSYIGRTITGVSVQGSFPMTPCSFSYDARGRRASKTSNGVTHSYFYEGSALIRESITGSPSRDIRFFYHMSGAPAFMTLDGVAYYYVVDAFGSVVGLVDGNGSLVVTYSYDPWGKILSTSDTSGVGLANLNPLRYRSYYYDSETGWYLCGSRYYSPEWMRWVTPDSVDYLDSETPGGLDPYAYCYGDPVDYADPSGHMPNWGWWVLGGLVVLASLVGVVITAGGASPAMAAIWSAACGIAYGSAAVSVLSFAFVGMASIYLGALAYNALNIATAGIRGSTYSEAFYTMLEAGDEVFATMMFAGLMSGAAGYACYSDQLGGLGHSWTTERRRYIAEHPEDKGMVLHHPYGRHGANIRFYYPVTSEEHRAIHSALGYGCGQGGFWQYRPWFDWWNWFFRRF